MAYRESFLWKSESQFYTMCLLIIYCLSQITLLLQFSLPHDNLPGSTGRAHQNWIKPSGEIFDWLSVLWERGFCHGNPQGIKDLLAQSFN